MIDIGANLASTAFESDLEQVLQRAQAASIDKIIVTGSDRESAITGKQLADQRPGFLYTTAGLHPHHASQCDDDLIQTFASLLEHDNVVAIGETGLDYFRNISPREAQLQAFSAHLELAKTIDKPLFLHERDAFEDFRQTMQHFAPLCERAIVHCFTGSLEALKSYLDMGMYIGITGWICDEKRGKDLQEIVKLIPKNRLLVETDAPYLTPKKIIPKPKNGRNEPSYLPYVIEKIANIVGENPQDLAYQTSKNSRTAFNLK